MLSLELTSNNCRILLHCMIFLALLSKLISCFLDLKRHLSESSQFSAKIENMFSLIMEQHSMFDLFI